MDYPIYFRPVAEPASVNWCSIAFSRSREISVLMLSDRLEDFGSTLSTLRSQLFNVNIYSDGWDAYYYARAALPNIILIDAQLGSLDSITFCRLVRSAGLMPRTGIILATRNNEQSLRTIALELGVLDILSFPLIPEELMIRMAVHRRMMVRNCDATVHCRMRAAAPKAASSIVTAVLSLAENGDEAAARTKQLARAVGTSERRLSALFKAEMGEPLATYLRRRKINKACRLLVETSMSIKDVAAQLGFNSPCNFTVAFQQRIGMSPSSYRKLSSDRNISLAQRD